MATSVCAAATQLVMARVLLVGLAFLCLGCFADKKQPNIVFILTDDQDVVLGGLTPMTKTKKLLGDAGLTFSNMFTTSPLCCPSRSSILTGNYVHNHGALNNSISGNCSSPAWQDGAEKNTFITYVKQMGYSTFFAGKYLNQYGDKLAGGVEHIPPGWDWWIGLVHNSVYYDYTLSVNGTAEKHGKDYKTDYLTDLLSRKAQDFLTLQNENNPFFMMISTPACHAPFDSAPQYVKNFTNKKAPRTPSYNKHGSDKHWLVRSQKTPMLNVSVQDTDDIFRKRWRTLLSVDDLVEGVVNTLQDKKLLDNTYIVFSSDNGYHLGQFSMPRDKRQLYEFDIRVPLIVRGPNVPAGKICDEPVLNIDLAPTFVELSGHEVPSNVDGRSLLTLLHPNTTFKSSKWRQDFLVEHNGEYKPDGIHGCNNTEDLGACHSLDCTCEDAKNNTYSCTRTLNDTTKLMYCEFNDDESFVELYDLAKDPDQLTNIVHQVPEYIIEQQNQRLIMLSICKGSSCRDVGPYVPPEKLPPHPDFH
ncbi:N-acetylglucosamine-6-sulfatase-like isoform X2 [Ptychodera flava]|uniref:N-acetylglucosamine-6-sulfatase-like isoform X2 n=1 Tax=Ptychodera flava TaxID=63121 RepID=UPI003969CB72